jgi:hypothetical protein
VHQPVTIGPLARPFQRSSCRPLHPVSRLRREPDEALDMAIDLWQSGLLRLAVARERVTPLTLEAAEQKRSGAG